MFSFSRSRVKKEAWKNVQRGARFLDREFPDWKKSINVEELDIEGDDTCVIGQLTGSFVEWSEEQRESGKQISLVGLGFQSYAKNGTGGPTYDDLTSAWKELLLSQNHAGN